MAKLKDGTRIYGDATVDQTLSVGNITISGNLVVNGTTTSVDSTVTRVEDPIFELGGGAAGAALTTQDNKERGILMHYWNGSADTTAYMGWHTTNGQFEFGAVATEGAGKDGNITIATGDYGNVKAYHFIGQGDLLANITGANVTGWVAQANYANYAGTVTGATQSNITLLGTQTSLTVSGTSNIADLNANGIVNLTNTASSTSTTSGALIVAGGVGVAGSLWVGGTLHANVSGSTSAPGANTDVVFNDSNTSNATGGFTFNKTSNTVNIGGANIELNGNTGDANIMGDLNLDKQNSVNVVNDKSGFGVEVYSANYSQLNFDNTNRVTVDNNGVTLETAGGNVTVNTSGDLTVDSGDLVLPNANVEASGSAHFVDLTTTGTGNLGTANLSSARIRDLAEHTVPFLNGDSRLTRSANLQYVDLTKTLSVDNVTMSGTANAANVIVTSLGDTRIPFANSGKALIDSANLTFNSTSNTLSVTNATLTGTANAAEVIVTSLTSTRVPFVDADKSLTDDSSFTFSSATLNVPNATMSGTANASNVVVTSLTAGRVTFAGSSKEIKDSANLTFDGTVLTVTGNVAATNILTDNLRYANGVAWDLQEAQGANGDIQFNNGSNNFTASANLNFDRASNTLTTDNLQLNANANVQNATVRSLGNTRLVFSNGDHKLVDSADLTYNAGNLGVSGNIAMAGAANITGANVIEATTGNITTVNSTNVNATTNVVAGGNIQANSHLLGNTVQAVSGDITVKAGAGNNDVVLLPTGSGVIDASGVAITNVGAPQNATDAATRGYVDSVAQGLHVHMPVAVASKTNIAGYNGISHVFESLANPLIIDGYTVQNGDRVLVKDQTTKAQNGIYDYDSGANTLTRSDDSNSAAEFAGGDFVFVVNGNTQGDTGWVQTEVVATLNTSDIIFSQFSGAGTYTANTNLGLILNGTVFSTKINTTTLAYDMSGNIKVADSATFVSPNIGNATGVNLELSGNLIAFNANFGGVVFSEGNVTLGSGKFIGDLQGNVSGNISGNIKVAGANGSIQFASNVMDHYGSTINANAISSGTKYEIVTTGSSDFTTIGAANSNPGTQFTATGVGTGDGTVKSVTTYGDLSNDGTKLEYVSGNLLVGLTTGGAVKSDHLYGTIETASQPNITSLGTLTSLTSDGNITINNSNPSAGILTDNLYYANGTAWDLQQAAGLDTYIQYNSGNNFAASSKFTFNPTGNVFTVDGNANITGKVETSNVFVSTLTDTYVTFAGASGKLINNANLTFTGGNVLTVTGNANITGKVETSNVFVSTLTDTYVTFAGASGKLVNNANLTFSGGNLLTVTGNANVTSTLNAGNVVVDALTGGRITFAEVMTDRLTDSANLTFDASSNTFTTYTANVHNINVDATANITGNLSAGNVDGGNLVSATYLSGKLTTSSNNQSNITTVGTLTSLTVAGTSNLNAIGNVYISGGTAGQIIQTDGAGNLSFVSNDTSRIVNGTSNVSIPVADGNINMVSGGTTVVQITGTGANVTGYITATGNIQGQNITATANIVAEGTTDATDAVTGTITTAGGISAEGNIYAGKAVGFAVGSGNTDSAAYIQFNSTSGSLDFIFN
jgi:hypothetical protein